MGLKYVSPSIVRVEVRTACADFFAGAEASLAKHGTTVDGWRGKKTRSQISSRAQSI